MNEALKGALKDKQSSSAEHQIQFLCLGERTDENLQLWRRGGFNVLQLEKVKWDFTGTLLMFQWRIASFQGAETSTGGAFSHLLFSTAERFGSSPSKWSSGAPTLLLSDHFLFFSCRFDRRPLQSVPFIPPQIVPEAAASVFVAILCRPSPGGVSGIRLNGVFSVFGASAWAQKSTLICDQRGD